MEPEDHLLMLCTRQNFQDSQRSAVLDLLHLHSIRWELVYSTALNQGVLPLVYVNLCQGLGIDAAIPQRITRILTNSVSRYVLFEEKKAKAIRDLLQYLNSRSLRSMLVKGAALNLQVYQCPWYTESKDADLVIYNRRTELADDLLWEISSLAHTLKGFEIEVDFFEHHDLNMNGILPVDFERIWRDALELEYGGQRVGVMSPEDTLISLCINCCRKRYLRLKSLCDIAEAINHLPELNWEKFITKARDYDCHIIVYTALAITKLTVGCEVPPPVLESLGLSKMRRALIDHSLATFFIPRISFTRLPASEKKVFGRALNLSMILPYISFRGVQAVRRINHVIASRDPEKWQRGFWIYPAKG